MEDEETVVPQNSVIDGESPSLDYFNHQIPRYNVLTTANLQSSQASSSYSSSTYLSNPRDATIGNASISFSKNRREHSNEIEDISKLKFTKSNLQPNELQSRLYFSCRPNTKEESSNEEFEKFPIKENDKSYIQTQPIQRAPPKTYHEGINTYVNPLYKTDEIIATNVKQIKQNDTKIPAYECKRESLQSEHNTNIKFNDNILLGKNVLNAIFRLRKRLFWSCEGILDGEFPKTPPQTINTKEKITPDDGYFVYCLSANHDTPKSNYNPYKLICVTRGKAHCAKYWFTVSASMISMISNHETISATSVKDWLRERCIFNKIHTLDIFANFRKRIQTISFHSNPILLEAILTVQKLCEIACPSNCTIRNEFAINLLKISDSTHVLTQFEKLQSLQIKKGVDDLKVLREKIEGFIISSMKVNAKNDDISVLKNFIGFEYKHMESAIMSLQENKNALDMNNMTREKLDPNLKQLSKTKQRYGLSETDKNSKKSIKDDSFKFTEQAFWRAIYKRLMQFLQLIDCIVMDMIRRLVIVSVQDLKIWMNAATLKSVAPPLRGRKGSQWETPALTQKKTCLDDIVDELNTKARGITPSIVMLDLILEHDGVKGERNDCSKIKLSPDFQTTKHGIEAIFDDFEETALSYKSLKTDVKLIDKIKKMIKIDKKSLQSQNDDDIEVYYQWPDRQILFDNDEEYQQCKKDIMSMISTEYEKVSIYLKDFKQYCTMVNDSSAIDVFNDVFKENINTEEFNDILLQTTDQILIMSEMELSYRVGIITINASEFKNSCLPYPETIISNIQSKLPKIACQRNEEVLHTIKASLKKLETQPVTVEEAVDHVDYLIQLQNEIPDIAKQHSLVTRLFSIAMNFDVPFTDEQYAVYHLLTPSFQSLKNSLTTCEAKKDDVIEKFANELKDLTRFLSVDLQLLKNKLQSPFLLAEETQPSTAIDHIKIYAKEVGILLETSASYAKYESQYDAALSSSRKKQRSREYYYSQSHQNDVTLQEVRRDLSDVERGISLRLLLWQSIEDWHNFLQDIEMTSFDCLNVVKIQADIAKFVQAVFLLEKGLGHNNLVMKLKSSLNEFNIGMPLIESLRNPSLRQRHWVRINSILGLSLDEDHTLTIVSLLKLNISEHTNQIIEISNEATNEANIENMLQKVIEKWQNYDFTLIPNPNHDIGVISQIDQVVSVIDDSQINLANLSTSKFAANVKTKVDEWIKKISSFSNLFKMWMDVQKGWLHFETIFSAADIQRQLSSVSKVFIQVDKSFKDIMKRVADHPNALYTMTFPGFLETLKSCKSNLEIIRFGLEDYLEGKRQSFARLYFLTNDELIRILANTKHMSIIEPYCCKCFSNIQRFHVNKNIIKAVVSNENETFQLQRPLLIRGQMEQWLGSLENILNESVKRSIENALLNFKDDNYVDWFKSFPGQASLVATEIILHNEITTVLRAEDSQQRLINTKQRLIVKLQNIVNNVITTEEESMYYASVGVIMMMVHTRDIIDSLINNQVENDTDFEWLKYLRFEWDDVKRNCTARQLLATFTYGNEYHGCCERLVITPLTDRCYLTLTTCLHLNLNGAPVGPAGTGKTETVKDLAKSLGKHYLVFNCSDGLDLPVITKLLCGIAQSGAWCCFDEFNRIDIEVLSVLAQYLSTLKLSKDSLSERVAFEGKEVNIQPSCAVFITMNPGYAGRVKLPDNVKALFRPVAMVTPAVALIAEIMLFSNSFQMAGELSRKLAKLYEIAGEQLTPQKHYDFGLRAVKTVLVLAGRWMRIKRHDFVEESDIKEFEVDLLTSAILAVNLPKLVHSDESLFHTLLQDIFPSYKLSNTATGRLEKSVDGAIQDLNLQRWSPQVKKVHQLQDTLSLRHGVIMVGDAATGKTTCRKVLAHALKSKSYSELMNQGKRKQTVKDFQMIVDIVHCNPHCLTMDELYGVYNKNTRKWKDGLVASTIRRFAAQYREYLEESNVVNENQGNNDICDKTEESFSDKDVRSLAQWLIFDGPINTVWVENLNSLLDDTKALCLTSGEQISFPPVAKVIFEVDDLANVSPATISRCGVVYCGDNDLTWIPIVRDFLKKLKDMMIPVECRDHLSELFDSTIDEGLEFIKQNTKYQIIKMPTLTYVSNLCALLSGLLKYMKKSIQFNSGEDRDNDSKDDSPRSLLITTKGLLNATTRLQRRNTILHKDQFCDVITKLYMFAYVWTFGGNFDSCPEDCDDIDPLSFIDQRGTTSHVNICNVFDLFLKNLIKDKNIDCRYPSDKNTVYHYYVDIKKNIFSSWSKILPSIDQVIETYLNQSNNKWNTIRSNNTCILDQIVPTMTSIRYNFITNILISENKNILINGKNGVGKTLHITHALLHLKDGSSSIYPSSILDSVLPDEKISNNQDIHDGIAWHFKNICYRPSLSCDEIRSILIENLQKYSQDDYHCPDNSKLVLFIDDLHMACSTDDQPNRSLEVLREFLDHNSYYDPHRGIHVTLNDIITVCSSNQTHGISSRLLRHFGSFCLPDPSIVDLQRIYATRIGCSLQSNPFSADVRSSRTYIVNVGISIYIRTRLNFKPIPSKPHYLFNTKDLTRMFINIASIQPDSARTRSQCAQLLAFEVNKVFCQCLATPSDKEIFSSSMEKSFHASWIRGTECIDLKSVPRFGDIAEMNSQAEKRTYQRLPESDELNKILENYKDRAYLESNAVPLHFTFFPSVVDHILQAVGMQRVKHGHLLMIGRSGTGRACIAQLSASIGGCQFIKPKIQSCLSPTEFKEELQGIVRNALIIKQRTVLYVDDKLLTEVSNVELLMCIICQNDLSLLFDAKEIKQLSNETNEIENYKQETLTSKLSKLHIIISLDVNGNAFKILSQDFPSLITYCYVDWYDIWPCNVLVAVADNLLSHHQLSNPIPSYQAQHNNILHCILAIYNHALSVYNEYLAYRYVTPRLFIQFINTFWEIFKTNQNKKDLKLQRLHSGLGKLEEANSYVSEMETYLTKLGPEVEVKQKETEVLLVQLQKDREVVNSVRDIVLEQQKIMDEETEKTKIIADQARLDLMKTMPQFDAAILALNALDKGDISEIRVYTKPPHMVTIVISAVCVLLQEKTDWSYAKGLLGDPSFLKRLIQFDRNSINDKMYNKIKKLTSHTDFNTNTIGKISVACRSMCQWVLALKRYTEVYRVVKPKQERCVIVNEKLAQNRQKLHTKTEMLRHIEKKLESVESDYSSKNKEYQELNESKNLTSQRLIRAKDLIAALSDEKVRWEDDLDNLNNKEMYLAGECVLTAAMTTFCGELSTSARSLFKESPPGICQQHSILISKDFNWSRFMIGQIEIEKWFSYGLPNDCHSIENAVLIDTCQLPSFIIDPQMQASDWIKSMTSANELMQLKSNDVNLTRSIENALRLGSKVILEVINHELPSIMYTLCMYDKKGSIKIHDSEIEINQNFKLYIITRDRSSKKLSPHLLNYLNIVNFYITNDGLKDQLLSVTVNHLRSDLEIQRIEILKSLHEDRSKIQSLEDHVLELLDLCNNNILDDGTLVDTLEEIKTTSLAIQEHLNQSIHLQTTIEQQRILYLPIANRGTMLYFLIDDISHLGSMYEFSLKWFVELFQRCLGYEGIDCSTGGLINQVRKMSSKRHLSNTTVFEPTESTLQPIIQCLTYETYAFVSRGLSHEHRLVFLFHLCCQSMLEKMNNSNLLKEEIDWLIKSTYVNNDNSSKKKEIRFPKWMTKEIRNDCESLVTCFPDFNGLVNHLEENEEFWLHYLACDEPLGFLSSAKIDNDWSPASLSDFQRLMLVKCFQPDKFLESMTSYTSKILGKRFMLIQDNSLSGVYDASNCRMPIVITVASGVDSTAVFLRFAQEKRGSTIGVEVVSLGRGQGQKAIDVVKKAYGLRNRWVLLQNCHLALSFMPKLQGLVETIRDPSTMVDPDFRLWLSTMPTTNFSNSILRDSAKQTIENAASLSTDFHQSISTMLQDNDLTINCPTSHAQQSNQSDDSYKQLVIRLCFFHSIIQQRKLYGSIGWNVPYDFTLADLEISANIMKDLSESKSRYPVSKLAYVIGSLVYGGKITDPRDQHRLSTLLETTLRMSIENFEQPSLDKTVQSCSVTIMHLTSLINRAHQRNRTSKLCGFHANSHIHVACAKTHQFIATLNDLYRESRNQSRHNDESDGNKEHLLDILSHLPKPIDLIMEDKPALNRIHKSKDISNFKSNPISVALKREITSYNNLLDNIQSDILNLQSAIDGNTLFTDHLDNIHKEIINNKVPKQWKLSRSTNETLALWCIQLEKHVEFFNRMMTISKDVKKETVVCYNEPFWMPAFLHPKGFLTALLQYECRKKGIAIDTMSIDLRPLEEKLDGCNDNTLQKMNNSNKLIIDGFCLDQAIWNPINNIIELSSSSQRYSSFPPLVFNAIQSNNNNNSSAAETLAILYNCPIYANSSLPSLSYITSVNIPTSGDVYDFVTSGVALIC